MDGKLVQIVFIESLPDGKVRTKIQDNELQKIVRAHNLSMKKVIVICVAGLSRTGKSFLMNLLIHYAYHKENHKPWRASDEPVRGFGWRRGAESVTIGVWIWDKPIQLSDTISVLLMDTQGIGAEMQSGKIDRLLLTASLQLSDMMIYNIQHVMRNTEVLSISKLLESWRHHLKSEPIFAELLFLYRDWTCDDHHGYDSDMFIKKLNEVENDDDLSWRYNAINKAFSKVSCFKVPYPGKFLCNSSEWDNVTVLDRQIKESFINHLENLFEMILGYGTTREYFEKLQEKSVVGLDLRNKLQNLKEWMENETLAREDEEVTQLYLDLKCRSILSLWDNDTEALLKQNCDMIMKDEKMFKPVDRSLYIEKFLEETKEHSKAHCYRKYKVMLEEMLENSENEFKLEVAKMKNITDSEQLQAYATLKEQEASECEDARSAKLKVGIFATIAKVFGGWAISAGIGVFKRGFYSLGMALINQGAKLKGLPTIQVINEALKIAYQYRS